MGRMGYNTNPHARELMAFASDIYYAQAVFYLIAQKWMFLGHIYENPSELSENNNFHDALTQYTAQHVK